MRPTPSGRPGITATLAVALLLSCAGAAPGDVVHLTNGNSYEDVVAESGPDGVRIQLPFGEITLPHSQVASIEEGASVTADYLERREALTQATVSTAQDWLELARWARVNDVDHGVREAALMAAELDPELEGLEPLLRPFGLVYDDSIDRWVGFDEYMARRGFVPSGDRWVTREEHEERLAEEHRRRREEAEDRLEERLAAAALALEEQRVRMLEQAYREQAAYAAVQPVIAYPVAYPIYLVPAPIFVYQGGVPRGGDGTAAPPPSRTSPPASHHTYGQLVGRQPGSLLPTAQWGASSRTTHR